MVLPSRIKAKIPEKNRAGYTICQGRTILQKTSTQKIYFTKYRHHHYISDGYPEPPLEQIMKNTPQLRAKIIDMTGVNWQKLHTAFEPQTVFFRLTIKVSLPLPEDFGGLKVGGMTDVVVSFLTALRSTSTTFEKSMQWFPKASSVLPKVYAVIKPDTAITASRHICPTKKPFNT